VIGTAVTSAAKAAGGTQVVAPVACAAGHVLLGGGALITTSSTSDNTKVALTGSYPLTISSWVGIGTVQSTLSNGQTMTVTPYAFCSL
jgi:hypothetical protein